MSSDKIDDKNFGKIYKSIEYKGKTVALYLTPNGTSYPWNVYCFENDKLVWRISPSKKLLEEKQEDVVDFTAVFLGKYGELLAYGWTGFDYIVDHETGQASRYIDPDWPPGYKPRSW